MIALVARCTALERRLIRPAFTQLAVFRLQRTG